jgi:hypothetical protein
MMYLARNFGDALAFLHASEAWGRLPAALTTTLAELLARPPQGWLRAMASEASPQTDESRSGG